ncbi:MAG: 4Fe-4S binding protein [Salaquimonas sp.]
MGQNKPTTLICNCEKTMQLNASDLAHAFMSDDTADGDVIIHTHLCRSEIGKFEKALADNPDTQLCIGCTQESALFSEIAAETNSPEPIYFNIREKAGWSSDAKKVSPKAAALIAQANVEMKPARTKSIISDGLCLVIGKGQSAFEAAELLNKRLSVTLLLTGTDDLLLPHQLEFPVFSGKMNSASGTLGSFDVIVDQYASMLPSSKSKLDFAMARDGAKSRCSVILDITGATPMFSRHQGRDGYFRADPKDPAAVMRAVIEAGEMVGEFEKPLYVSYDSEICAHSRSKKTGCSKCIDNCPAGAITSIGDIVEVDNDICGGCGNCAAHCPTGAVTYSYPVRHDAIRSLQTLSEVYHKAGGKNAVLLFHDTKHGMDLINAMARFGKGLPHNVIPFEMHSTSGIGHDAMLAALCSGFTQIAILADPAKLEEFDAVKKEIELANAFTGALGFGEDRISLLVENDPDIVERQLWSSSTQKKIVEKTFNPLGNKREVARNAITILATASKSKLTEIMLPEDAPYGAVNVNTEACTLCLACVSSCPADALRDNPDTLQLRFVETACVQCGICEATCPENAISLQPRFNLVPNAMQPMTLYEEEPFKCIKCDTPFASQSTIARIGAQLAGSHRMFADKGQADLLKMCDTCKLETLAAGGGDPFAIANRPAPRTTDDYIVAEREGLTIEDFLNKDDS